MLAQRVAQQSLRRLAVTPYRNAALSKFAVAPTAILRSPQFRQVATQKMSPADSMQILVEQRKKRPTSPHLSIYEPQIPWILSILNRITGCILSGTFYIFGSAYLVAPLMGWNLSSVSIAAAFGSWPVIAKVITKLFFALPFTFHSFNGIRHLVWDMGKAFKNNTVIKSGWTLVGLSVTSALGLALFL